MRARSLITILISFLVACGSSGGDARLKSSSVPELPEGTTATPLVLVAGMAQVDPVDRQAPADLDYERVGFTAPRTVFELTAPSGKLFEFDVLSQGVDLAGPVRIHVAHVADNGAAPTRGAESITRAGVLLSGPGQSSLGNWFQTEGDGFARATFRGSVESEQIYAVRVESENGIVEALVCVRPGPESPLVLPTSVGSDYPDLLDTRTLYSSPSLGFGLPVVAVSGDRTSVVAYEGDRDSGAGGRYEMRLQFDHVTGLVTGGAQQETSPDNGNWRDHDIAALFNVLAVVRAGREGVDLRVSFDRGATFEQAETFPLASPIGRTRLASIAIAADYSLAVSYWRPTLAGGSELVVMRGTPDATAADGSPTHFAFGAPDILHIDDTQVVPLITGLAWSDGGDLVVGYGFTRAVVLDAPGGRVPQFVSSQTIFRCGVLPWNGEEWIDSLVDWSEQLFSRDPSVAVTGSYPDMRILYAYEGTGAVMVAESRDGGRNFLEPTRHGPPTAYMPTVMASGPRVDLFYLATGQNGTELFLKQWRDYANGAPETYRLTTAVRVGIREYKTPWLPGNEISLSVGSVLIVEADVTQVGNFGYDVARAGDELHVVVDEHRDHRVVSLGIVDVPPGRRVNFIGVSDSRPDFEPATPPMLAEGLTDPVPAPVADHRHQLRLLRLR